MGLVSCAATGSQAQERRGATPGDFDFYVLALSWSPGFCGAGGGDGKSLDQCRAGAELGFVVHGLWPQGERGFPVDCAPANRTPSRLAIESAKDLYPDEGLARYQWRKHGTCSGVSPTDYYAGVRTARDRVAIPAALRSPREAQTWTAVDLERAFVAANPGLRADMLSIACRGEVLQEVRVCFSKDLRGFQTCPEVDRRGCRARQITVPPVR
ncbi:ribonuclease T2 [Alsobacter sp. SYSU M60028]|uniref:Ribonuclease T2 n=1 Tax=Alsobacter ponti TaxID=2962936 RepID=A0ABT1L6I7_9HYPH|nr:ribonuclease T2 [Alsobacter ponti]